MSDVRVDVRDQVQIWTLNHPPVNAIGLDMLIALEELLDRAEADATIRSVVITASGPTFAAGADIQGLTKLGGNLGEFMKKGAILFERIHESRLPFVSAVNGVAYGGGNELAMATDIRVAAPAARFGQPEVNLGIIPGWGGTVRLPQLVGQARARRILLTGDSIDAEEAHRIGLVDQVVPQRLLLDVAVNIGDRLASLPPLAMKELKTLLSDTSQGGLQREGQALGRLMVTADAMEGIQAFMQRRRPQFKGQ